MATNVFLPRPLTSERHWTLCLLHTDKAVLPALFFTDQPQAQQLFSPAVNPHIGECVGWLAAPGDTGKSLHRSAYSTVAMQVSICCG